MTPLHIDLLLALNGAAPYGLAVETLLSDMRKLRHRAASLPQVERALRDLTDQSLITTISTVADLRWRITGLGTSTLQEAGLA